MTLSPATRAADRPPLGAATEGVRHRATLEIVDGLHRGVRLDLHGGDWRIGSTAAADIVLRDAGIAPEHALLRVGPRTIELQATGGDVRLGKVTIAQGHGCALRLPVDLAIGEARLRIRAERPAGSRRASVPAGVMIAGAVLFAIPPLWVVAPRLHIAVPQLGLREWLRAEVGAWGKDAPPPVPAAPHAPPSPPRAAGNPPSSARIEEAARRLALHLGEAGLRELKVSATGGHIIVEGTVSKKEEAAWTAAEQWFDEAYAGQLVITANVGVGTSPRPAPVLNVQAVWLGERPHIVTTEGTRYYKGAFLDSGWIVKDITRDRILLTKEGETLSLVYSDGQADRAESSRPRETAMRTR
jgi:type III secretion protein D